ncbi:MAG: PQQ-binding-like beta-propeller repeat protein [Pirellulaceae bacterium]|jgi:outer membrane protein assembly factor BamB|nr:PQQ-binding-like beta-propeller repeat protein [Pirellulaceae bacterium]MDP6555470.1 PQQ-binding-like beta-propeller repeat protein [Pirellulaceae bacterium]
MYRTVASLGFVFVALAVCGADWLQFRGNNGASVSLDEAPPDSWDGETNIAWRSELPGKSASSPIVVKGRVIVTSSSGVNQDRLHVLAYDVETGRQIWSRQFWATGRTLTHPFSAVAAPTPASDGQRIFAFYSSNDLICLDLDGNLLWYRGLAFDFPKAGNDIGMSSSPVVADETVMVQIESQGESFAMGVDVATGETRWRVDRARNPNWASPVVMPGKRGGKTSVILQSKTGLVGHDIRTGEQLWKFELPCETTPSLAVSDDRIFVPANGLTALDLPAGATTPALAWNSSQLNPSPASPIVAGDRVYAVNGAGVLSCADLKDGKRLWQVRIGGRHWSTPVLAGNRIFCVNADGKAKVVQLGESGKIVGTNDFGETVLGSPAVSDGALYVRSNRYLWKIAEK